ncbi:hypothetical protein PspLS_11501, partial [Pyricularia sp. CBS 133598]
AGFEAARTRAGFFHSNLEPIEKWRTGIAFVFKIRNSPRGPEPELAVLASESFDGCANEFLTVGVDGEVASTSWIPVFPKGDPGSSFIVNQPPVRDFTDPNVAEAVRSWIHKCQNHHAKHRCPGPEPPLLPKRVVQLVGDGDVVRVVSSHQHSPQRGHYATLSYCWGGPQAVVATRANLAALETNGIRTSELGRTIQDAIRTTRILGLKYIWIDALCIVQDDEGDKAGEIPKMGEIYANCIISIAASSASSSKEGFLDVPPMCNLPEARAWALQEYLLPPRILSFQRLELVLYCRKSSRRRVSPSMFSYALVQGGGAGVIPRWGQDYAIQSFSLSLEWRRMLMRVTRRRLTDPDDRVRAVEGVVSLWADAAAVTAPRREQSTKGTTENEHPHSDIDIPLTEPFSPSTNGPASPEATEEEIGSFAEPRYDRTSRFSRITDMRDPRTAAWGLELSDGDVERLKVGFKSRSVDDKWDFLIENPDGRGCWSLHVIKNWLYDDTSVLHVVPAPEGYQGPNGPWIEGITWEGANRYKNARFAIGFML